MRAMMTYELTIHLKGGAVEIEADTQADLLKRVRALHVPRLEAAIREARAKKPKPAARGRARKA